MEASVVAGTLAKDPPNYSTICELLILEAMSSLKGSYQADWCSCSAEYVGFLQLAGQFVGRAEAPSHCPRTSIS